MTPLPTALAHVLLDTDASLPLYTILDGAAIPDLLDQMDACQPDSVCLYRGPLTHGMDAVAPYLVRLEQHHPFTSWLLSNAWGSHFGVFLHSDADHSVLRHHLRHLLQAKSEQGRRYLFRYYDPRVLRIYAPSLNRAEADEFFGPIVSFLSEAEDPGYIVRFTRQGLGIQCSRRSTTDHGPWTNLTEPPTPSR